MTPSAPSGIHVPPETHRPDVCSREEALRFALKRAAKAVESCCDSVEYEVDAIHGECIVRLSLWPVKSQRHLADVLVLMAGDLLRAQACNAHDQLLKACKALLQAADNSSCCSLACDNARAAIAAAEVRKESP
jgi:hypothetical protein